MKPTASKLALTLLICSACPAQTSGSICIAPIPSEPPTFASPDLVCRSTKRSLEIDSQQPIPWSYNQSQKLDGLDLSARHQVVVFCDSKPQQTFRFRFTTFKSPELCLYLDGFYQTLQLHEAGKFPSCRSK